MSAKKNKLSAGFEGREKKKSVVQRFFMEEEQPEQIPEIAENAEVIRAIETESEIQSETPPQHYLKNTMEDAVIDEVIAALKHMPGVCKCEKCFYDMCAIALNSSPALYATSEQGELFGKASAMLNIEMRNKISSAVFDAIDKVKKIPMHRHPVYNNSVLLNILKRR